VGVFRGMHRPGPGARVLRKYAASGLLFSVASALGAKNRRLVRSPLMVLRHSISSGASAGLASNEGGRSCRSSFEHLVFPIRTEMAAGQKALDLTANCLVRKSHVKSATSTQRLAVWGLPERPDER
jgi:hypothetical protein